MRKFIARFRQAPMFSSVYILGAALSVASVMLVAIFLHVKTSNIYPEYARDRLLYNNYLELHYNLDFNGSEFNSYASYHPLLAQTIADSLKEVATVALVDREEQLVRVYGDDHHVDNVLVKTATPEIFTVYNYEFLEGGPFADVSAPVAVISDNLARKIFGTDRGVTGRKMRLSNVRYAHLGGVSVENNEITVSGVFREGSRLLPLSFAEILLPLNIKMMIDQDVASGESVGDGIYGDINFTMLPHEGVSKEAVSEKFRDILAKKSSVPLPVHTSMYQRYDSSTGRTDLVFHGDVYEVQPGDFSLECGTFPRSSLQMSLGNPKATHEEVDFAGLTKLYGVLILILLLVPALNLSSLIAGNMDTKMSEMGIRKAFGARNSTLLRQVINENLWLTGCGAILGVILAWIGVLLWKEWLFAGVGSDGGELSTADIMLDPSMLFAPKVFIVAVVICVVLNLLSSLIPAWWALRRPAIDAIRSKA